MLSVIIHPFSPCKMPVYQVSIHCESEEEKDKEFFVDSQSKAQALATRFRRFALAPILEVLKQHVHHGHKLEYAVGYPHYSWTYGEALNFRSSPSRRGDVDEVKVAGISCELFSHNRPEFFDLLHTLSVQVDMNVQQLSAQQVEFLFRLTNPSGFGYPDNYPLNSVVVTEIKEVSPYADFGDM